ncbi:sigma-70 family RNA polymerase sigma factor [Clostridium tertium]|uniref:sigma-70 family RNA polymerase sigma factor n=1 Tax=Clostridium tertium TaxID=1559 RepID=UPI0024B38D30|nr:sigma-70 family RNA polymerase sigma factor [Clostridium tertium]MDI9217656.1 sigma-70 family RNA polymerase sigma factor [Clostridium tertium]
MNDTDIVLGIINKDEKALTELINTYGKLIYGVINKILNSYVEMNEIDECFNDILISLWRNLDCYDSEKGSLRNFLISVAKYKAIDYKRIIKKINISLEIKEELVEGSFEDSLELDNDGFFHLLKSLKEEDKNIFIKRYLLDETVEKISEDLGLSKDLIYKRIARGREKIRNNIDKEYKNL